MASQDNALMGQRRQRDNFPAEFCFAGWIGFDGSDEGFELNARPHLPREAVFWNRAVT